MTELTTPQSDGEPATTQASGPRWRVRILGCLVVSLMTLCGLIMAFVVVVLALGGSLDEFGQRRTGLNVLQDLYTSAANSSWQLMPEATIQYARSEFDVRVTINSQGLRADQEYLPEPAPGTFRIMTLGDSFVEALQVSVDETFSAVLESCLNENADSSVANFEVINGGVSNYGPGDAMLYYEHFGADFQPDVVILTIYIGNGFLDTLRVLDGITFRYGGYRFSLNDNEELAWDRVGPPEFLADLRQNLLDNRAIWRVMQRIGGDETPYDGALELSWGQRSEDGMEPRLYLWDVRYPNVPPDESLNLNEAWPVMQSIILRLRDLAETENSQLAVLLLPSWDVWRDGDWDWFQSQAEMVGTTLSRTHPQDLLTNWLAEVDIPVLDVTPNVVAALDDGEPIFLLSDGHFSLQGQALIGQLLCQFAQDEGLIP